MTNKELIRYLKQFEDDTEVYLEESHLFLYPIKVISEFSKGKRFIVVTKDRSKAAARVSRS